ncbi:MAG: GNAT family N-acetyltransferase [Pseudobutyrivibrio sp.]|nr:GNAT family N-acetyltransferase [Pseudobutyrivibrio sp.]
MNYYIREALESDAERICQIYGYYVDNTYVTFTEINHSVDEYRQSIIDTKKDYPYFVACDENDRVIGMAYGGRLRPHDAYKYSVETTIYLDHDIPRQSGIGKALYEKLEEGLKDLGYKFMYGVITDDNAASIAFHKHLGFEEVGHFKDIGYKKGNWKGIVWYRKQIGDLNTFN